MPKRFGHAATRRRDVVGIGAYSVVFVNLLRAIACADVVVSLLLELIERTSAWDHTAIIVTGDHGMTEVHTQLRPNVWLTEAGLRPERLDGSQDWRATFQALGGCAFCGSTSRLPGHCDAFLVLALEHLRPE